MKSKRLFLRLKLLHKFSFYHTLYYDYRKIFKPIKLSFLFSCSDAYHNLFSFTSNSCFLEKALTYIAIPKSIILFNTHENNIKTRLKHNIPFIDIFVVFKCFFESAQKALKPNYQWFIVTNRISCALRKYFYQVISY